MILWSIIFLLLSIGIFLIGWLSYGIEWIESLGIAGSVASMLGIAFTIIQVKKVKSTTQQINDAVESSNRIIKNINSIEDLSKHISVTEQIVGFINRNDLECAFLRMSDLQKSLSNLITSNSLPEETIKSCFEYERILLSDLKSLNSNIKSRSSINLDMINEHIIELGHFFINTNNSLKQNAYAVS